MYANYLPKTLCWENQWSNIPSCGHPGVHVLIVGSLWLELHDLPSLLLFICPYRYLKPTPCMYYHDTYLSCAPHAPRNIILSQTQWILKNESMVWSSRNTIESPSVANTHPRTTQIEQTNKQARARWQAGAKSLQHSDSVLCLVSELLKNFLEYHQDCLIRIHFPCQSIP